MAQFAIAIIDGDSSIKETPDAYLISHKDRYMLLASKIEELKLQFEYMREDDDSPTFTEKFIDWLVDESGLGYERVIQVADPITIKDED